MYTRIYKYKESYLSSNYSFPSIQKGEQLAYKLYSQNAGREVSLPRGGRYLVIFENNYNGQVALMTESGGFTLPSYPQFESKGGSNYVISRIE